LKENEKGTRQKMFPSKVMASQKKQGPNQHSLKKWTMKRTAFYYNKEMLLHQESQEENPKSRKSAPAHLENPERISKTFLGKITY
jgi:hypothetical protein